MLAVPFHLHNSELHLSRTRWIGWQLPRQLEEDAPCMRRRTLPLLGGHRPQMWRFIVIAVPDGYEARRVLERAREIDALAEVLVRAHGDADRTYLQERGATRAISAEYNVGSAMAEATLSGLTLGDQIATKWVPIVGITYDPKGVVCGRGRNPTLRIWPPIFTGEVDVLPSERRDMGQ